MTKQGSILDYVRGDIDQDLWQTDSGEIKLRPEIRTQILDIVGSALDDFAIPESALKGLYIYGSILTNQYNDKTDVDCRILLSKEAVEDVYPELTGDDIFDVIEDQVHGILLGETQHPLNCSIVIDGEQEELGRTEHDPVYDVLADKLIKGPVLADATDPEEEFTAERDDVDLIMEYLDELLREAKTKTIDYEVLKEAVGQVAEPKKLQEKLEKKLKGIQDDIEQLVVEYEAIKKDREEAYSSQTIENPHKQPGNVRSKYLERYQYLDTLKKLKKILKGGVSSKEIPDVEKALKLAGSKNLSLTASYDELNTWEEILGKAVLDAIAKIEAEIGKKATDEQKLTIAEDTKKEFLSIEGDRIEELIADLNDPGSAYGGSVKDYVYDICYSKANWLADELIE